MGMQFHLDDAFWEIFREMEQVWGNSFLMWKRCLFSNCPMKVFNLLIYSVEYPLRCGNTVPGRFSETGEKVCRILTTKALSLTALNRT
ncbi:hypothetical protein CEXT_181421 [Caerostris extrusa]|uniref:Uncharacterized protein n=1 Tax=Caerostris extrusa TaxID=172846 RepID=A0AAV4WV94_CAEEX|nr:hypothetical protein CEXT_181421 [Caerostris extrusa]